MEVPDRSGDKSPTLINRARDVQIFHLPTFDTEQLIIGLDEQSKTVCIRTPLVFSVIVEALSVKSPTQPIIGNDSKNQILTVDVFRAFLREKKTSFKWLSISKVEAVQLHDIYFYQGGETKPRLRVWFSSLEGCRRFRDVMQGRDVEEEEEEAAPPIDDDNNKINHVSDREDDAPVPIGIKKVKKPHRNVMLITEGLFARFRVLETDIAPYWHWLFVHKLQAGSTVVIPQDATLLAKDDPSRISKAEREYVNVASLSESPHGDLSTNPLMLMWDIESLSKNPTRFPNACALQDCAFFISAYIKRYKDKDETARRVGIYLVDSLETLGLTEPRLADGTELIIVPTEAKLLEAFWNLVREVQPQIFMGYNTFGFDSRYLHHRMSLYHMNYPNMSLLKDNYVGTSTERTRPTETHPMGTTKVKQFSWSSSAAKSMECWYYETPGMLCLDMFVELKRSENLKAYTLEAVSQALLGEHKVDLKAREMFDIYLAYQAGVRTPESKTAMRRIAEYGVQDSVLPARLFDHRNQWVTYTQMSSIMGVGIMDLISRGQTLRTKANIYKKARSRNFVINIPFDKPMFKGKFRGAYVCEMTKGIHDDVIVFDFASLYPSTIAAYNLCYSTFIHRRDWHKYKKEQYTSHFLTVGAERVEVRYINADIQRGILPEVVEGFLKARADTRKLQKTEKDPVKWNILEKKQLAIKISNNSVYGAVGADFSSSGNKNSDWATSSLGLKWIAMTVTEIGQLLIKGCTAFMQEHYKAVNIYGDTDSTFLKIPPTTGETIDGKTSLWRLAEEMQNRFNETLPKPLTIELEKIIRMVGLTAKRYIYRKQYKDGNYEKSITYKGVVATRRDTCLWQVKLFEGVAESVLQNESKDKVTALIYDAITRLMMGQVELKNLLIGGSVAESYKKSHAPMAVLKKRLAEVGRPIAGGSRIQYFMVNCETVEDGKIVYESPYWQGPKGGPREEPTSIRRRLIEEYRGDPCEIDYPYYVSHLAKNSVDQLFGAAFHGDTIIEPLVQPLRYRVDKTLKEMQDVIRKSR